jgi:hypothetical protein
MVSLAADVPASVLTVSRQADEVRRRDLRITRASEAMAAGGRSVAALLPLFAEGTAIVFVLAAVIRLVDIDIVVFFIEWMTISCDAVV